jgi:NADPH2:quinone reductase
MKFIDITQPGGPDVLQLTHGDAPLADAGELLIEVAAAGVNRPDVFQRMGHYPAPPDASPILGLEVAGTVQAVGEGVSGWAVGDSVCALVNGGGYAEQVSAPADQCLPVPNGLSMVEAASLPETCFTVWSNLFDRAGLVAGETLLIHGGSSGIGTTAIQMARASGVVVYVTAGSDAKCRACVALGAEVAVNYRTDDFVEVLKEATAGHGVDVILDMVGGDYIARNIKLAALDGRIVNIAYLHGSTAEVDFMPVMLKRLILTGSTLRPQSAEAKAAIALALRTKIWPLVEAGEIKPQLAEIFPMEKASAAHELMESSEHIGKIVLQVS